jgi:hypothetical protein
VKDLRPLSSPGRRKQGVRGFMNLIFEKSSAGEEMRMIIFCGFLVCLAAWGFTGEGGRAIARVRASHRSVIMV